jgi:hypothetical protein
MQAIAPLFDYLADLELAVDAFANTWRPDDPAYRADAYSLSSTNGHYAKISADGKFRTVISLKAPGV